MAYCYCCADQLPGQAGVWVEAEVAAVLEGRHDVGWFELLAPRGEAFWLLRLEMVDGSCRQAQILQRSREGVREATLRALEPMPPPRSPSWVEAKP